MIASTLRSVAVHPCSERDRLLLEDDVAAYVKNAQAAPVGK